MDRRTECAGYCGMKEDFQLIDDVLSGTTGMRRAGKRYLPQEEGERKKPFDVRVARSFFFGAYAAAIENLLGKPFAQEVTVDEMPAELEILNTNCDREGTTLTQFMREDMQEGINRGVAHTLVDMPTADGDVQSAKDEMDRDIRPFFVEIPAKNLFDWSYEIRDGRRVDTMIKYCETIAERDGKGREVVYEQIREWYPDRWETWRKSPSGAWGLMPYKSGPNPLGEIPLDTWYINRTGYKTGKPAMRDLAEENVHHWQSSSDYDNIIRFLVPTLALYGWDAKRLKKVVIGINKVLGTTKPKTQAHAEWLVAPAHSAEAVRKAIEAIERRMERLGAKPLIERSAQSTATGKVIDERMKLTSLQQWITAQESHIERCIRWAAKWLSVRPDGSIGEAVKVSDKLRVKTYSDFSIGTNNQADMGILRDMRANIDIDQRTLLKNAKRRDVLSEDDDVDKIIEATEAEKASPFNQAKLGFAPGEDDEEEQEQETANAGESS